ncbi:MAG TPA: hypothetical protein VLX29_09690 [Nitrospirota bacterium]|nr:hypothetical protein [Nitrospirota bacterium]
MKGMRKVFIFIGVFIVIIAAVVVYVLTNLDSIVKAAIERYGSETTKTAVRVSSVAIHLTAGEGEISGLSVANPHGFTTPSIFYLGKISTKIDTRTVTSSPIIISELHISDPQVVYEMNTALASNILVLKKNIQESMAESKKPVPEGKKAEGKEKKIVIKKLIMDNGRIEAHIAALGDKPQEVTLRHFEMTNIGGHDGATPSQLAEQILTVLVEQVGLDVSQAGLEKTLDKEVDRAVKRLLKQ